MAIDGKTWHDWWPIIYQAVALNVLNPEKYPLHKNFWGYQRGCNRGDRRIPNAPFPESILRIGPCARLRDVGAAIGYRKANLDAWLLRRFEYISMEFRLEAQ